MEGAGKSSCLFALEPKCDKDMKSNIIMIMIIIMIIMLMIIIMILLI